MSGALEYIVNSDVVVEMKGELLAWCPANLLEFGILEVHVMLLKQNDQYAGL